MKNTLYMILLILAAAQHPVRAASRGEIPARVMLKDQSGAVDVVLTGRRGDIVNARMPDDATGSITFHADDIKRIAVAVSSEPLYRAEAMLRAGQSEEGLALMRDAVRPLLPYVDLPIDGAVKPALRYAAAARSMKAWSEAVRVYTALEANPDDPVHDEAVGWLAYSCMKNMQPARAAEWLEAYRSEDPASPGFIPAALAGALLAASEGRDLEALDLASRAVALARIDHELYPEALFTSASAYYNVSSAGTGTGTGTAPAAEVVAGPAAAYPLPMPPAELLTAATGQFARVVSLFPSSGFAAMAGETLARIESEQAALSAEDLKPTATGETR